MARIVRIHERLVFSLALAAALQVQASLAQESSPPNTKRPSSFAGSDALEASVAGTRSCAACGEGEILEHRSCSRIRDEGFRKWCFALSDNGWQSAFLVTDAGVIVFDMPASYGKHIPEAVAKVTNKPIKMLVYSTFTRIIYSLPALSAATM